MGIRERVSFLKGAFEIIGRKNQGTKLTVSIPFCEERAE
jgi:signal transduction histidine kinase